jgi:hypothetical protein
LGIVFLIIDNVNRNKAKAAQNWTKVGGVVRAVQIREHVSSDTDDVSATMYEPVVEYEYSLGGQTYTGRRIAFGAIEFDQRTAQTMAEKYQAGAPVTVSVNPANPNESVLEVKARSSSLFLVLGIVFLVIGLGGCCIALIASLVMVRDTSSSLLLLAGQL